MTPLLSEVEQRRATFRMHLMEAAGWDEIRAKKWALRLAARDLDQDDRRLCVECRWLTSKWQCCAAKRGPVLAETLQRCSSFGWEKPATSEKKAA